MPQQPDPKQTISAFAGTFKTKSEIQEPAPKPGNEFIQINLVHNPRNHLRTTQLVDEFLEENNEYMEQPKNKVVQPETAYFKTANFNNYLDHHGDLSSSSESSDHKGHTLADEFLEDDSHVDESLPSSYLLSSHQPNPYSSAQTRLPQNFLTSSVAATVRYPQEIPHAPHHVPTSSLGQSELEYSMSENLAGSSRGFYHQPARKDDVIVVGEDKPANSLADAFLKRMLQRQSEAKRETHIPQVHHEEERAVSKPGKTKEELAEIRRQMMKRRPTSSQPSFQPSLTTSTIQSGPKDELMARLAKGEKVAVPKEEMLKLTQKNYELLPEVKQRKKEEQKKEEYKLRMKQVKELESKRREMLKK